MANLYVEKAELPQDSLVAHAFSKINYGDSYRVKLPADKPHDVIAVTRAFAGVRLGWVAGLMSLRNKVVKLFGLKTVQPDRSGSSRSISGEPGTKVGIFKVFQRTTDEILMGEDDKHLNFRVSILVKQEWAVMSTVVQYNNWLGKAYFLPVQLFHRMVVPSMLRKMKF